MDRRLVEAAIIGDFISMKNLALLDPGKLLRTTPQGNTCLHISSIHGSERFCKEVLELSPSLLATVNADGETALLTAVTSGHLSLASVFLRNCLEMKLSDAILKQDKHGCNALHLAIRSGHTELALELIAAEPGLSRAVNQDNESPMFIAVMRNYPDVSNKLLEIPDSAHSGAGGYNALHAAVRNGNSVIAERIMETRPWLAREENRKGSTPVHLAVLWDKIDVLKVLLEHDMSLGYVVSTKDAPLLNSAAYRGHVRVARELLNRCPDAPYCNASGWTCLHEAVCHGQTDFVEFVLGSRNLRRLVHMRDNDGKTALHHAVQKCNPKMVAALVLHQDIDVTVLDNNAEPAIWELSGAADHAKTLNWVRMLSTNGPR